VEGRFIVYDFKRLGNCWTSQHRGERRRIVHHQ
jgi:hypothetical protein